MEAICTQCQMRYEVGEELLQQGTPILCPTCQVSLTMVHPGTTIPLDQPLSTEPQAPEAQAPETQEGETAKPEEPAPSWDSGDLLGAPASAQEEPAGQEQAPARDSEELSGWGEPSLPPPAQAQPEPEPVPPEEPPEPEPPMDEPPAEEPPQEEVAPEPEAAPAFPEPEIETEAVQEEAAAAFPEPEVPAESEPAAPEPRQQSWDAPEAAPAFETPTWDAPAAPPAEPEAQPAQPAPAEQESPEQPAPQDQSTQAQAGKPDDWASAAARWAASGFSTENMPDFVRAKEEGQDQFLAPPAQATFTPPSEPPPEPQPEIQPTPPFAESQPPQPQASPGAAPPPLPSPAPPPLEGRGKSVYVMKGSGEGVRDGSAPWAEASVGEEAPTTQPLPVSAPLEHPARAQLEISAPLEEPVAKPAAQVEVPKPKHTGLWILFFVILIGAGGYLAYYFVMKSRQLDQGKTTDKVDRAGVPSKPTLEKPPVADVPSTTDAGQADAGKPPEKKPDQAVAKPEVKKPEKPVKQPPKRRKKKKVVSSKEAAKLAKKKSLEFYKKGNELIRKRNYPEAIKYFKKALKANPKLAQAHRGLGICYAQRRRNKAACREYRIYLKMIPPDSKEVPALRQILKGCK